jgi:hypothetical protein
LVIAGLLAFQVVRTAAVRLSPGVPSLWPGHPRPLLDRVMAEIGARAARGETLTPRLLGEVQYIARTMPLAPEPFLIHGALAQTDGRDERAERLYLEARARDPRSMAARYFLADRYLRTGHVEPALSEMATLSRLSGGPSVFAPALAQYARSPGAVEQLRRFFQISPDFEVPILENLSTDPQNLGLVLALWSGRRASSAPGSQVPGWQTRILAELIEQSDFAKAYLAWRSFVGVGPTAAGIFNPEFRQLSAPAPFNWTFGASGGLAEPTADGELDVIYFGRDEAVLAKQLLMLGPGRYRFAVDVKGDLDEGSEISWSLKCQPNAQLLMRLPLAQGSSAARLETSFVVPQGCRAQSLELAGLPGEFPETAEFTLAKLQLTKVPGA